MVLYKHKRKKRILTQLLSSSKGIPIDKKNNKILDPTISKKFKSIGFEELTEIQKEAIPEILEEKNAILKDTHGNRIIWPREDLPEGIKEKDILSFSLLRENENNTIV